MKTFPKSRRGRLSAKTIFALKELTLSIYSRAVEYASNRGIIICDTKFEFGIIDGQITIVDEMLTPDSSRFWPAGQYFSRQATTFLRQTICARLSRDVSVGINSRRRRSFPMTSFRRRAPSTSRPCAF